jgi:drug/metabolite transporter (DMT)-like permease
LGLREWYRPSSPRSYVLALLLGLNIASYSLIDKLAVGLLHPIVYLAGLGICCAVFMTPYVLLVQRSECRQAWREYKVASLWIGFASMGTYLLVLAAFQRAHASYVVAARELAIAIAAALGVTILKEPLTMPKALSTAAIIVGVILVKVA